MLTQTSAPGSVSGNLIKSILRGIVLGTLLLDGFAWALGKLGLYGSLSIALWIGVSLLVPGVLIAWKGLTACGRARRFHSLEWEVAGGLTFAAGLFLSIIGMILLAA